MDYNRSTFSKIALQGSLFLMSFAAVASEAGADLSSATSPVTDDSSKNDSNSSAATPAPVGSDATAPSAVSPAPAAPQPSLVISSDADASIMSEKGSLPTEDASKVPDISSATVVSEGQTSPSAHDGSTQQNLTASASTFAVQEGQTSPVTDDSSKNDSNSSAATPAPVGSDATAPSAVSPAPAAPQPSLATSSDTDKSYFWWYATGGVVTASVIVYQVCKYFASCLMSDDQLVASIMSKTDKKTLQAAHEILVDIVGAVPAARGGKANLTDKQVAMVHEQAKTMSTKEAKVLVAVMLHKFEMSATAKLKTSKLLRTSKK